MADDPLNVVYSFVERAYMRLQAGDILLRCLEEGHAGPIHQMVEGLVLAGPQSLSALREILAVTDQRRSQAVDDLHQVIADLEKSLKSYGVQLVVSGRAASLARLTPVRFLTMLREQGVTDNETQVACLQLFKESRQLMSSLVTHLRLLEEIEIYLRDWLWGLAYQSARQGETGTRPSH